MRQCHAKVSVLVVVLLAATVLCGVPQAVAQPASNGTNQGRLFGSPAGGPAAKTPPVAVAPPAGDSYPQYGSSSYSPPTLQFQPTVVAPKPGTLQFAPTPYPSTGPGASSYATQPPVSTQPYGKLPPKPGVPAMVPVKKPLGPPGAPKQPWGNLGEVAVEVVLHLLSGNNTHVLSGIDPVNVSRNNLLSGKKLQDSSPFSFMSGNKLEIRISHSFNNNRDSFHGIPNPETPADEQPAPGAKTGNKVSMLRAASVTVPAARSVRPKAVSPSERFKQLDLNGDGVITLEEYLRATAE